MTALCATFQWFCPEKYRIINKKNKGTAQYLHCFNVSILNSNISQGILYTKMFTDKKEDYDYGDC